MTEQPCECDGCRGARVVLAEQGTLGAIIDLSHQLDELRAEILKLQSTVVEFENERDDAERARHPSNCKCSLCTFG